MQLSSQATASGSSERARAAGPTPHPSTTTLEHHEEGRHRRLRSGKSYLARELGSILDAPVTHLDAAFYDDEWNALPMEKFAELQRELVAQPRWVIDGNYNSTLQTRLEVCDTVVLMDVSTVAALYGIFSRQIRHGAGHKGNGVHNRIHWGVVKYVATYRRKMRPRVMAKIEEFASGRAEVVLLSSRRQTRRWLRKVATEHR